MHAFCCVLALTMVSLLQRELHRQEIDISISHALESLREIKEVALFHTRSRKNPLVTVDRSYPPDDSPEPPNGRNPRPFRKSSDKSLDSPWRK